MQAHIPADRYAIPVINTNPKSRLQVLVYDDVLGAWSGHKAKFVRHFGNSRELRETAIQSYGEAVRDGSFPDSEAESYSFHKSEWARFLESENNVQ